MSVPSDSVDSEQDSQTDAISSQETSRVIQAAPQNGTSAEQIAPTQQSPNDLLTMASNAMQDAELQSRPNGATHFARWSDQAKFL
jgi:hypothetical protein